jgi:iron uptake system component EfeO
MKATEVLIPVLALLVTSCGGGTDPETQALLDVKAYTESELESLSAAIDDLRQAAPEPDADGWNPIDDPTAVEEMKAAWRRARASYERIEGAIAVLFPMVDRSTDERYDGFIEAGPDPMPFDGEGVTGMHAVERILWADAHPPEAVAFESALPNYAAPAFPANEAEARAFRDELLQRLADDVEGMREDFAPLALDPASAFRGVIGSMAEQLEKVNLAATGEDESRYSQNTLGDMRANLEGGRAIYEAFRPWLDDQPEGEARDAAVLAGLDRIQAAYDGIPGDAIPAVPTTWNPDAPSAEDLATPYGQLFELLSRESDPESADSLVTAMSQAADALGIPQLP